jgi:hypothetical protein
MNSLRVNGSPEATDQLWALANGPNLLVKEYSVCIVNGIRFLTRNLDNRRISQNSGVSIEGDHEEKIHDFYGHLLSIWELEYMCHNKVFLFQCEWYNTGNTGRRKMIQTEKHCTSIDVSSRWYQNDPFILPIQAKQVFYLRDTKLGGHWQVVQCVQLRGVFNVLEVGDGESNDDTEANDAFQQETIAGVVPIEVANNDRYCRDDVEAKVIPTDETMAEHGGNNEDEEHDIPDVDMDVDMNYDM